MKIAIIGSGISGISSAWLLNKEHDITLFEKNDYLGGHSNTATINYDDVDWSKDSNENNIISVDTGFIVFNFRTYPNLKALFEYLDVKIEKSDMSFGVKDLDGGLEYSGNNLCSLFSQKRNLFNPKYLRMLFDIVKFNKAATKLIEQKQVNSSKTLLEFIDDLKLGTYFKEYYLLPMAAAIWSCPMEMMKNYPAKTFLQFFYNHGLLTVTNQPQWYTVRGGSKEYVKNMTCEFKDKININTEIKSVSQSDSGVILEDALNNKYEFDKVIFASHSDQTFKMISDKTDLEEKIIGDVKYSKNTAILHKDETQMPKRKKAWASWIYLFKKSEAKVSLSYWMNNLQNINHKYPLFVTLNPTEEIDKNKIFGIYHYEHPIFDLDAIKAQENLDKIQGSRNMYFAGAWTKYGFHEDGLNSAINVCKKIGVKIPWLK